MNGRLYWKQRIPMIFVHLLCMAGLSLFLIANGNSIDSVILVLSVWVLVLALYLCRGYFGRKRQLEKLLELAEQLEERYLISEVMDKPEPADDRVYYRVLKMAGKSMLENVEKIKRERAGYKEYIEEWIHEIKTPIAAMKLICENNRTDVTRELLAELEKTERFTEQALYYARSEYTERDYFVREIRLFSVVHRAIADNKYLFLQNDVRIDLQETDDTVFSDEKWLCFILNQLIVNAVKYSTKKPVIKIYIRHENNVTVLCIEDNGVGIEADDMPRIFEKGFTGKNGRGTGRNATGIGLYLCRRLCYKLGIGINAKSSDSGTQILLSFYTNDFINQVQG